MQKDETEQVAVLVLLYGAEFGTNILQAVMLPSHTIHFSSENAGKIGSNRFLLLNNLLAEP